MRELLEQGWGVAGIAVMTGIGVLARLLLLGYYGTLSRACARFETTKNRTIAYIREDLKRRDEREQEIKNALTYTECRLAERRFCGFRIGSLETLVPYSVLLTGVSGILVSMASLLAGSDYKTVLQMLLAGGISITGLMILDLVSGLRERNKRVHLRLRDYIENSRTVSEAGAVSEESATAPELFQKKAGRKERKEEREARRQAKTGEREERKEERKKQKKERWEAKKNRKTDKPKTAAKKKNGKAQEEKRRLTEELLRERRQLEARSLAEQRRKEREEEDQAEQVQAEAAIAEDKEEQAQAETSIAEDDTKPKTELSYEALLNEFLKEYPA